MSSPSAPPHPSSHHDQEDALSTGSSLSSRGRQLDSIILQADTDVSQFSEKVNELSNLFRKEVMQHFFEIRQKIGEQHAQKISSVQSEHNELQESSKQEMARLEEKIAIRDHYLAKFKDLTFRMADQIAYVRRMEREKAQLRLIIRKWSLYSKERKMRLRNIRLAEKHYNTTMQRKIISRWFAWTMRNRRNTNELAWESRTQAAVSRIRNDFNTHLADLTKELEETKKLLRVEQKDKVILQENLKKAMMRGVCAMNNKFMEIIKDANESAKFVEGFQMQQNESQHPGEENVEPNAYGGGARFNQQQQHMYQQQQAAAQYNNMYNSGPAQGMQQSQYNTQSYNQPQQQQSAAPKVHVFREPVPDRRKTTKRRQHPLPSGGTASRSRAGKR